MYTETIGITAGILSLRKWEEFPFRECPSSVKEFSYKNNWRVFINGVDHHSRWQSRCLLESNIEIKVYTAEKQKQQTNQGNRRETKSS